MKNISTKIKLMLFPILFVVTVLISGYEYLYYSNYVNARIHVESETEEIIQKIQKGRISVYQFLRNPSDENKQKTLVIFESVNKDILDLKSRLALQKYKDSCDLINSATKEYISSFEMVYSQITSNRKNGIDKETQEVKDTIFKMAQSGVIMEEKIREINEAATSLKLSAMDSLNNSLILIAFVSIILFAVISVLISNMILKSLNDFRYGLLSFFDYLNRKTSTSSLLDDSSKDEFGEMAVFVNENIRQIEETLNQDIALIEDAKVVMNRVNNGWYSQFIEKSTANVSLEEFKNNVNQMIQSTRNRFAEIDEILEEYARHNYIPTLVMKPTDERGGVFERLVNGINSLQNSITQMLVENKANGLTLDESSNILLSNVDKLNQSSNEAAASLEETAAAIEEITSNIRNNTENISKMAVLSSSVTSSATQGEKLANETTVAMDDINNQVNLINDAI